MEITTFNGSNSDLWSKTVRLKIPTAAEMILSLVWRTDERHERLMLNTFPDISSWVFDHDFEFGYGAGSATIRLWDGAFLAVADDFLAVADDENVDEFDPADYFAIEDDKFDVVPVMPGIYLVTERVDS